jgi:hypothetical protein
MFPLLSQVLSRNDLEIDLTGPLAPWAHRYLRGGLIEIQFFQIEIIATLGAFCAHSPTRPARSFPAIPLYG